MCTECASWSKIRQRFTHLERKFVPVRDSDAVRGTMGDVLAALSSTSRVSLVARRHIDFKRVCTCCCPR
jgi:hypothetical protein